MLFDAPVAQKFAARMYELGVLLSGFFYPVVPMGQARRARPTVAPYPRTAGHRIESIRAGRPRTGLLKN
jgi:glycine C-acetyltransferase